MKSPTSSSSGPTETVSAPTATETKTVSINDNEEVVVGKNTDENYFMAPPQAVNDSAFKCVPCNTVTIHSGFEIAAMPTYMSNDNPVPLKRVYMCTNCGKFSSK